MKNKKFLALTALILCLSMLFVACSKEEPEPLNPPAPSLADIFNLDWTRPNSEQPLISKAKKISLPEDIDYEQVDNLLIYTDPSEDNNKIRVYDFVKEENVLLRTDSSNTTNNYTITVDDDYSYKTSVYSKTKNYVYAPNGDTVIVLTVKYTVEASYLERHESYYVSAFDDYIHDYLYDFAPELKKTTYTINVYNASDTTKPIQTVNSNTIKSWINQGDFDYYFDSIVIQNLPVIATSYDNEYIAEDLFVNNGKIYRCDNDDNVTFVRDVGLTNIESWYEKANDYYIASGEATLTLFDSNLKPIATYEFPSYALNQDYYVLNSGNVWIQYHVQLDEDATEYDIFDPDWGNEKYDVVTLILSAQNGAVTEINANYTIETLETAKSSDPDYNNYYNASISNLALVYYIKDGRLNTAETACDIVALDDNGTITKSLKLFDTWASLPSNIGNGYFVAYTTYGTYMVMDKDSNVITDNMGFSSYVSGMLSTYDYVFMSDGIYNTAGEKVYDLSQKDAWCECLDYERNIAFFSYLDTDGMKKYKLFNNGTVTDIGQIDAIGESTNNNGTYLQYVGLTVFGYYTESVTETENDTTYTYKYYSADGTWLATTHYELYGVAFFDGTYLYAGEMETGNTYQTIYFKFS